MQKVHVITGGSGGIGIETAKLFTDGVVLISDINETGLEEGKKQLKAMGLTVETEICDISNRAQIHNLLKKAAHLGEITNVIHTAGISPNISNIKLIIEIDLIGTELLLEELESYLNEKLVVICVASMVGYTVTDSSYNKLLVNCLEDGALEKIIALTKGDPTLAYNIAKRGVQLLCEKWSPVYGEKGSRIISVSPGIIETNMAVESRENFPEIMQQMLAMTPLKRHGEPEEIAGLIKFLCSPAAAFITGTDILIDGGLIKNMLALQSQQ